MTKEQLLQMVRESTPQIPSNPGELKLGVVQPLPSAAINCGTGHCSCIECHFEPAPSTFNSCDFEGTETMPAPSTAGEREVSLVEAFDNARKLVTPEILESFDALLQSTADHIPDAGEKGAAMPVGELTLEQITRIYDRYGGDMVNCTRAIERELAAARSQPTTEESSVVAGAQPVREPLTDYSDTATIAGLESSVGHLSVMVDELRLMLGDAMNAMTELHSKVTPDEDTPNIDGIVPAAAYAKFVDAHADLLYRIHHSPHAGQLSRLPM